MSTQVVRVAGYNKGSLGTIGRECDRADGVNHRNQEINTQLSFLNQSYKDAPHGFNHEWNDIVTSLNAQGKVTKNGVAFEGMIVTADLQFFESLGYRSGEALPKECRKFFDEAYAFAKAQIGYQGTDKNIISAKIHLDEKTPHLHLYYVPITEKWQSKVYAKGEDGKVLRTDKGTPIQAKDERGKTIYEQHEDVTAPKLSKSEFWRVRGGQHSYRMMQDRFHEMVGQKYGLERGEIGSDRKHKETAVWKQEQLTAETERLEAEVQPLRDLKAGTVEVEAKGKTVLPGVVAIKKKDLEAVKEQAKAYTVNRDEIETLRERSVAVSKREQLADRHEQLLDERTVELVKEQQRVQQMYQRQLEINQVLERTERERDEYKRRNASLTAENRSLRADIHELRETLEKRLETLRERFRGAYESLTNIVKAVGMLKYDKTSGYKVAELTPKQSKLIDGIAEYGAKWAKEDGFSEMAEDMEKHVGISKGIAETIDPPQRQRSYDWDMEL